MTHLADGVVAIDLGGTAIKAGILGIDGRLRHAERHPTGAERGGEAVVATILDVAEGLAAKARSDGIEPRGVGLVVPGVVDEEAGVAVWAANVDFRDVPLRALVAERLGLPVALGHDVRAGGLAEARLGAGRGVRHVLFVAIGTGIAGAHIRDGVAFAGARGAAGEIGHVVVRPGGLPCGCGGRGCVESVASAAAVARRYAADLAATGATTSAATDPLAVTSAIVPEAVADAAAATAADVATLAAAGDPVASAVWRETVDVLADGLLTAQALFDPEVVVIGGGLAEADEVLLAPLRSALRERLTFHREPRLVRAALGDEAGCLGAGLLALDLLKLDLIEGGSR